MSNRAESKREWSAGQRLVDDIGSYVRCVYYYFISSPRGPCCLRAYRQDTAFICFREVVLRYWRGLISIKTLNRRVFLSVISVHRLSVLNPNNLAVITYLR